MMHFIYKKIQNKLSKRICQFEQHFFFEIAPKYLFLRCYELMQQLFVILQK